jgi:uncharacterized protein involved in propanediol utilization
MDMETKNVMVPMPIELHARLQLLAKADQRAVGREALVLLEDAIAERERVEAIRSGEVETQINMPTTNEEREAMIEKLR